MTTDVASDVDLNILLDQEFTNPCVRCGSTSTHRVRCRNHICEWSAFTCEWCLNLARSHMAGHRKKCNECDLRGWEFDGIRVWYPI